VETKIEFAMVALAVAEQVVPVLSALETFPQHRLPREQTGQGVLEALMPDRAPLPEAVVAQMVLVFQTLRVVPVELSQ
jgi:hypothetical protein